MRRKKIDRSDEILNSVLEEEYEKYSNSVNDEDANDESFHRILETKKVIDSKETVKAESKKDTRKLIFTVIIGGILTIGGNVLISILDNKQKEKNMEKAYEFEENGYTVVNPAGRETQRNLFR